MCKECGCGGEHTHESHGHGMDVHVPVLDANDRLAERNRGFFAAKNLLVINVFSSPGSGKTSLLQKTAEMLRGRVRMGVIVGDLATDNDAERLSRADIIENVGNLVCPASYDLGEGMRVVLLSVTEGEDKPLKYPPMFHSADVALVTKSDLADAVDFDRDAALAALNKVAHHAHVIELSSKTGEGMDAWCDEIVERARRVREGRIQHHGHHHH